MLFRSDPQSSPWQLPPLILHPFSDPAGSAKLAEASQASLELHGLIDSSPVATEELERRLLAGRYCEIQMLFYIGKDLVRWASQCLEFAGSTEALNNRGIAAGSFIRLLIDRPPESVARKLQLWGVFDFKSIFRRAFGLHAVFESKPAPGTLTADFLKHYHTFADQMFASYEELHPSVRIDSDDFQFELYASGEYSKLLEKEWGAV